MTIKELRAMAKVMDECGIVFLKTKDIELHRKHTDKAFHVEQSEQPKLTPIEAPIPEDIKDKVEHKTVELTSVMKLSDMELVDSLFPDHTQEVEAS